MAKQLNYTDPITGQVYPEAYWRPTQINISFGEKRAFVRFQAYVNQAARAAGRLPIPGAVKEYDLKTDAEFDARFGDNTPNINIRQIAYKLAAETKDALAADGTPIGFFEQATDLL